MPGLLTDLRSQAKALPPQELARSDEELFAMLDSLQPDVDAAWDEALRRRIDDVERGAVQLVSADEAFAAARCAIGR